MQELRQMVIGSYRFSEISVGGYQGILFPLTYFYDANSFDVGCRVASGMDYMGNLSADQVNAILQNGLLNYLYENNIQLPTPQSGDPYNMQVFLGIKPYLRAEELILGYEKRGLIGYEEVLGEIQKDLDSSAISDSDKIILQKIQKVYNDSFFKKSRLEDQAVIAEQARIKEAAEKTPIEEDLIP